METNHDAVFSFAAKLARQHERKRKLHAEIEEMTDEELDALDPGECAHCDYSERECDPYGTGDSPSIVWCNIGYSCPWGHGRK